MYDVLAASCIKTTYIKLPLCFKFTWLDLIAKNYYKKKKI